MNESINPPGDEALSLVPSAPTPTPTHTLRVTRIFGLIGMIGLVAGAIWILQGGIDSLRTTSGALYVGSAAPDFSLKTLDGQTVRLSSLRGRTVIVNFWATWCPPCRAEMPDLNQVAKEYGAKNVTVLAVDEQEGPVLVAPFVKKEAPFVSPILDLDGAVAQRFHVTSLPSSFFIGPDGTIRAMNLGAMNKQIIIQKLQQAQ